MTEVLQMEEDAPPSMFVGPNSTLDLSLMTMYYHPGLWWEKRRRMLNLPEKTVFSEAAKFQQSMGNIANVQNENVNAKYDTPGIAQDPQNVAWFERSKGFIELAGYVNRPYINVEQYTNTPANEGTNAFAGSSGAIRNNISRAGPEMAFPKVSEITSQYADGQAGLYAWNLSLDPKDPLSQQFAQSLFDPQSRLNHQVYFQNQIEEAEADKIRRTTKNPIHPNYPEFAKGKTIDRKRYPGGFPVTGPLPDDEDDNEGEDPSNGDRGELHLNNQAEGMISEFTRSNPESSLSLLNRTPPLAIRGVKKRGIDALDGEGNPVYHTARYGQKFSLSKSQKEMLKYLGQLSSVPGLPPTVAIERMNALAFRAEQVLNAAESSIRRANAVQEAYHTDHIRNRTYGNGTNRDGPLFNNRLNSPGHEYRQSYTSLGLSDTARSPSTPTTDSRTLYRQNELDSHQASNIQTSQAVRDSAISVDQGIITPGPGAAPARTYVGVRDIYGADADIPTRYANNISPSLRQNRRRVQFTNLPGRRFSPPHTRSGLEYG